MDFQDKLDEVAAFVESARSVPMSSSILIDKAELTRLLDDLRWRVPEDLIVARAVLNKRQELLAEATATAKQLLEAAAAEQRRLVHEHEVLREARVEADEVIRTARHESEQVAREAADWVDAKLAHPVPASAGSASWCGPCSRSCRRRLNLRLEPLGEVRSCQAYIGFCGADHASAGSPRDSIATCSTR